MASSEVKKVDPRIIRAYYVGNIPVCYLFRHFGPDGREWLYVQTPRISHSVKTIAAADALVVGLLRQDTPMVAAGYSLEGQRVGFKVASVSVQPTSDAAEFEANPQRIGVQT